MTPIAVPEPESERLVDGVVRTKYRLHFELADTALTPGVHAELLRFVCNDGTKAETMACWAVKSRFSIVPSRLFLVAGADQPRGSRSVVVRSSDSKSFRILAVDSDDEAVRCEWRNESKPVTSTEIKVTAIDQHLDRTIIGQILLKVATEQGEDRIEIPYSVVSANRLELLP
jgi:hypothetical protein